MPEVIKLQSTTSIEENGEIVTELDRPLRRRRRNQNRNYYPGSVQKRNLGNPVVRQATFNSRTFGSPFDSNGVVEIDNNARITLTDTLTESNGRTLLVIPEFSVYVGQVVDSNEWPLGSFFDDANPLREEVNYDVSNYISFEDSTKSVVVHRITVVNRTGETAAIGMKAGFRYIVNANRNPSASTS